MASLPRRPRQAGFDGSIPIDRHGAGMDYGGQGRSGTRMTSQWGAAFLAALLAWGGVSVPAFAQTAAQFCYQTTPQPLCDDTQDKAEAKMRAAPENASFATLLVQDEPTLQLPTQTATYVYRIKDQPATPLYTPSYQTGNGDGSLAVGGHGCTPSADPNLGTTWCVDETELVGKAVEKYRLMYPACSFTGATLVEDLRVAPYKSVLANNFVTVLNGEVRYGVKNYRTTRTCTSGTTDLIFPINKTASFTCAAGYERLGDSVANDGLGDLVLPALCAKRTVVKTITGPMQQVRSCGVSKHPCYPATGDKARAEPDFAFAGRTFTRHYHSLHQLMTNPGFAVGWSHTFGDRIEGIPGISPAVLVDETGTYESFVTIAAGRYRGENSTDKVLESFASGTVRWRLRLPGGEFREFDKDGFLLKISNPADPRMDATVNYLRDPDVSYPNGKPNGQVSTVTDSQGRVLRFEYSAARLLSRITQPNGATIDYGYDADSNLTTVDYGNGQIKRYHYAEAAAIGDASQRHHMTGITSETGTRFATFKYDARGRTIESRAFGTPNDVTTVVYDSDTQSTVTTASGGTRTYTIQPGPYRRITAVNAAGQGNAMQTFDAQGRLETSTDRRGVLTRYEYAASGAYRSAVVEAAGTLEQRREEVTRDAASNLVTEQRTYNAAGALKAKTAWSYNARNQIAAVTATDPADNATRTTGTTYCESADVSAPNSTCPIVGLLKQINGPLPEVPGFEDKTTYAYRAADEPGCATASATCLYRKGDLWKIINARAQVFEILAYDGAGRAKSVKDANDVITDLEHNARGWLTASKVRGTDNTSENDDRITRIEYWADGSTKKITQPDGAYTLFGYDDARRLTSIADGDGNAIVYTLNGNGDRVKDETFDTAGALRRTLSRTYNTLGQMQTVSLPNPNPAITTPVTTTYHYDFEGNPDKVTDALSRETNSEYDPLGRLTRTVQNATAAVSAMDRAETAIRYDALDRPTKVTDPKALDTNYTYNGFGDQLQLASPDTGIATASYDSAGNLTQRIDANGKIAQYAYDGLNRVTTVTYPQEPALNETYLYDVAQSAVEQIDCPAGEIFHVGRLSRMTDGSGSTTYCYNRFGDLTRKVQRSNNRTLTVRWQYAANGRLQSMSYPDGTTLSYGYDSQGRVQSIQVPTENGSQVLVQNVSYAPFGPVQRWTYGNGLEYRRTLNRNYQPGAVEDGPDNGTSVGISLGYQFDAVGNLEILRDGKQSQTLRRYQYDGLNRLISVKNSSDVLRQQYSYDRTGNRLSSGESIETVVGDSCSAGPEGPCSGPVIPVVSTQWVTKTYTYVPNTHRLATAGAEQLTHDAAGNITSASDPLNAAGPGQQFAYSAANRMSSANGADYAYTGTGERVRKLGARYSVHDAAGRWIGDYDVNGTPVQQAIWLGDLPVGVLRRNTSSHVDELYYVEPDALGTPRVVIDPTRNVAVWRWDLTGAPFGNHLPDQDPDQDGSAFVFDMRFPGQRYDAASGLHYNYFRDYDPSTGRYTQSDPIGLNGGMSTYGYVGGNPLTSIDPHGLVAYLCQKGSVLGIGIPINFVGGTDEQVKSMVQSIEKYWKGNIGGYVVRTSVVVSRNLPHDPTGNTIQVVQGEGTSYVDFPNGNTGAWFTNSGWGDMTPAHEAGHLMGLPDYSTGIMTEYDHALNKWIIKPPNKKNIRDMLDMLNSEHIKRSCGCEK
jgi:RHS repeat-associated protein